MASNAVEQKVFTELARKLSRKYNEYNIATTLRQERHKIDVNRKMQWTTKSLLTF